MIRTFKDSIGNKLSHWIGIGLCLTSVACHPWYRDQFTPAKWGMVYFITSIIAFGSLLNSPEDRPKFPNLQKTLKFLLLLVFSYAVSILLNWPGAYENQILDWLCFYVIVITIYRSKESHLLSVVSAYNYLGTSLVVGYGIFQIFGVEPFPYLVRNEFPSSFFGFQNMTAEFIGISVLLQIYSILQSIRSQKSLNVKLSQTIFLIVTLYYLKTLMCRSVLVALSVSLLSFHFLKVSNRMRCLFIATWACVVMMALPFIQSLSQKFSLDQVVQQSEVSELKSDADQKMLQTEVPKLDSENISLTKLSNQKLRLVRWMNTLYMIYSHPFGVGPGNFEFSYIPFHNKYMKDVEVSEESIVRSPHNGYLQLAAQNGVLSLILVLIIISQLAYSLWKKFREREFDVKVEIVFIIASILFILVDALFAFPMENAFPFYFAAIVIGAILKILYTSKEIQFGRYGYLLRYSIVTLAVTGCMAFNFSKTVEDRYANHPFVIAIACQIFPSNWNVCIEKAEYELSQQFYPEARNTALAVLAKNPYHFPAIRILAESLSEMGDHEGGCKFFKYYDEIFENSSSVHEYVATACKSS